MTAAVLLCAGGATRFKGTEHKLLTPFRGRLLVSWSLEHVLAAGFDDVIVVEGAVALDEVVEGAVLVRNPDWASGQATSLQMGIREAAARGHESVVVGLGDQPFVSPECWRAVADGSRAIVVAVFGGRKTPPVRLAREVWDLLPTEGDVGARDLIATRSDLVQEVHCDSEPVDIDTKEDVARWG
ncbi:MAG: nucleotidyltransferase family protein [Acidimicrobiales bacterium]